MAFTLHLHGLGLGEFRSNRFVSYFLDSSFPLTVAGWQGSWQLSPHIQSLVIPREAVDGARTTLWPTARVTELDSNGAPRALVTLPDPDDDTYVAWNLRGRHVRIDGGDGAPGQFRSPGWRQKHSPSLRNGWRSLHFVMDTTRAFGADAGARLRNDGRILGPVTGSIATITGGIATAGQPTNGSDSRLYWTFPSGVRQAVTDTLDITWAGPPRVAVYDADGRLDGVIALKRGARSREAFLVNEAPPYMNEQEVLAQGGPSARHFRAYLPALGLPLSDDLLPKDDGAWAEGEAIAEGTFCIYMLL